MDDLPTLTDNYNATILVITITACALGMVLFIYLFRMTGDFQHKSVAFGPRQRNMTKVTNPFVLELDESTKDIRDNLKFSLSILCPCHVVVVWGPNVQAFHEFILHPGRDVKKKMLDDTDQDSDLQPLHSDVLKFDVIGKHSVTVPSPECVKSESLGGPPRSKYPVAVFVFTQEESNRDRENTENNDLDQDQIRNDTSRSDESQDNAIIGLFTLIHLKDSLVTKDSYVIANYVKTAGVPIYSLQALFASVGDTSQETSRSAGFNNQTSKPSASSELRNRGTLSHQQNENDQTSCDSCRPKNYEEKEYSGIKCSSSHKDVLRNSERSVNNGDVTNASFHLNRVRFEEHDNGVQYSREVNDKSTNSIPECVVCQSNPAQCALLPCRHNCVCLQCLRVLHKCPMCRSVYQSYFLVTNDIKDDDSDEDDEDEQLREMQRLGIVDQMENFFEGVNQMVGFA